MLEATIVEGWLVLSQPERLVGESTCRYSTMAGFSCLAGGVERVVLRPAHLERLDLPVDRPLLVAAVPDTGALVVVNPVACLTGAPNAVAATLGTVADEPHEPWAKEHPMSNLDPAALAAVAEQLGVTEAEAAARLSADAVRQLTVGEHLDAFLPKLTENSRRTYATSLRRFADGFGPVCDQDCEPCLDPGQEFRCRCDCAACTSSAVVLPKIRSENVGPARYNKSAIETVGTVARRIAVRRGIHQNRNRAAKGKPKKVADGVGAQETAIAAMRALFQNVPDLIDGYDGLDVDKPHRAGGERRPLLDFELVELGHTTATGGDDPELDELLFDFGLQTGARRSGAYGLTLAQIRPKTQIIGVKDKYGREQDAPVSAELIARLLDHARRRGGPQCDPTSPQYRPDGPVFHHRTRSGTYAPIGSRRFDSLHDRWQRDLTWAAEEQLGYHHIRHTMAHFFKTHYGDQYAKRYLRHSKGDVTDTYGACNTNELARALADLIEYEHPLVHGLVDRRDEARRRFGLA